MKIFLSCLVIALAGVAAGIGSEIMPFGPRTVGLDPFAEAEENANKLALEKDQNPIAKPERMEYDFGGARFMDSGKFEIKIKNAGNHPLKLLDARVSCKECLTAAVETEEVAPGETGIVLLNWTAKQKDEVFRKSVNVSTNDPKNAIIHFIIKGRIIKPLRLSPAAIQLTKVSPSEVTRAKTRIYSYFDDKMKIESITANDKSTESYFQITHQPLAEDQLVEGSKSGEEIQLEVKSGLPLGAVRQVFRIMTNVETREGQEEEKAIDLRFDGLVATELTIIGSKWDSILGVLRIGSVRRSVGGKEKLKVIIPAKYVENLKFDTIKVQPDWLKVNVGKLTALGSGTKFQVEITVEVPAGSPVSNYLDSQTDQLAKVEIPTDNSYLGNIAFRVQFAVDE